MKPRLLLFGKNGQVGHDLTILLPGVSSMIAVGRDEVDLSQSDAVRSSIRETKPDILVNAAAFTAVDRAESEPERAAAINTDALRVIGEEARKIGATVIHYSTDYVFDGTKKTPYVEDDAPNPINVYGRTKFDGELSLEKSGANYLILRTSWVYGTRGRNFLISMLKLATSREELRVVDDQIGAPTWSGMIAAATSKIVQKISAGASVERATRGSGSIYHMTAAGQTSWHGFAEAILAECLSARIGQGWFSEATQGKQLIANRVLPISSKEYGAAARRPENSVLSNEKFRETFGFCLPDWRKQLRLALRDATPSVDAQEFIG